MKTTKTEQTQLLQFVYHTLIMSQNQQQLMKIKAYRPQKTLKKEVFQNIKFWKKLKKKLLNSVIQIIIVLMDLFLLPRAFKRSNTQEYDRSKA